MQMKAYLIGQCLMFGSAGFVVNVHGHTHSHHSSACDSAGKQILFIHYGKLKNLEASERHPLPYNSWLLVSHTSKPLFLPSHLLGLSPTCILTRTPQTTGTYSNNQDSFTNSKFLIWNICESPFALEGSILIARHLWMANIHPCLTSLSFPTISMEETLLHTLAVFPVLY